MLLSSSLGSKFLSNGCILVSHSVLNITVQAYHIVLTLLPLKVVLEKCLVEQYIRGVVVALCSVGDLAFAA